MELLNFGVLLIYLKILKKNSDLINLYGQYKEWDRLCSSSQWKNVWWIWNLPQPAECRRSRTLPSPWHPYNARCHPQSIHSLFKLSMSWHSSHQRSISCITDEIIKYLAWLKFLNDCVNWSRRCSHWIWKINTDSINFIFHSTIIHLKTASYWSRIKKIPLRTRKTFSTTHSNSFVRRIYLADISKCQNHCTESRYRNWLLSICWANEWSRIPQLWAKAHLNMVSSSPRVGLSRLRKYLIRQRDSAHRGNNKLEWSHIPPWRNSCFNNLLWTQRNYSSCISI